MPELAVELHSLSKRFVRQDILCDIHLSVRQGKQLALLGNNGSGKTTLLRILSTRVQASSGSVKVMGFDVRRQAQEVRSSVAYINVLGANYPGLTALENLRLAANLYDKKLTSADLEHCLARVGLSKVKDKLCRSFSSGMKKRLALARLLLSEAPLWLLDEPYAALDAEGREFVDGLLAEARGSNTTLIVATHEPKRVAPYMDSIIKIDEGRLRKVEGL